MAVDVHRHSRRRRCRRRRCSRRRRRHRLRQQPSKSRPCHCRREKGVVPSVFVFPFTLRNISHCPIGVERKK